MNRIKLALKLTCAAAIAWPLLNACGGEDRPGAAPGGSGGSGGTTDGGRRPPRDGGDASSDGSDDSDGAGGNPNESDASNLPGAPIVTITSPKALATPTADVVTGGEVTVLCTARKASTAGAADVDDSSVTIELIDLNGMQLQQSSATPTGNADEYRVRFPLVQVPAGRVTFRCSARELSASSLLGLHELQTFVDHGPRVTINEPAAGAARALKDPVRFDFTVLPERLADADPAADVDSVTFSVDGVNKKPEPVVGEPGRYRFTVDFEIKSDFPQPPSGSVAVTITTKNRRTTTGTVRQHSYFFALDGTGPAITIVNPGNTAVVGGEIALQFTVADEHAGNDPSKLIVDISGTRYEYGKPAGLWSENDGTHTFLFDSTSVSNAIAQVNINIEATDRVGNPSKTNHILYLDNQPPIVDLDPPIIRERVSGPPVECSDPFDPIGSRPPSDLARVLPARLFRALVWERTNRAPGATEAFYSGVKENSVKLFLHKATTTALVVDSDKDKERRCDEIEADHTKFQIHDLTGLQPEGDPFFGDALSTDPPLVGCAIRDSVTTAERLCEEKTSDLTRIIDHVMAGRQPVIYASSPRAGVTCTGISWEIASWVGREGWVCLAARAEDQVGNVGVSRPLRLCIDDEDSSNGTPNCAPAGAPSCTDGCVLPPVFEDELPSRILPRAQ